MSPMQLCISSALQLSTLQTQITIFHHNLSSIGRTTLSSSYIRLRISPLLEFLGCLWSTSTGNPGRLFSIKFQLLSPLFSISLLDWSISLEMTVWVSRLTPLTQKLTQSSLSAIIILDSSMSSLCFKGNSLPSPMLKTKSTDLSYFMSLLILRFLLKLWLNCQISMEHRIWRRIMRYNNRNKIDKWLMFIYFNWMNRWWSKLFKGVDGNSLRGNFWVKYIGYGCLFKYFLFNAVIDEGITRRIAENILTLLVTPLFQWGRVRLREVILIILHWV